MRSITFLLFCCFYFPSQSQTLKVLSKQKNIPLDIITITNFCNQHSFTAKAPYIDLSTHKCDSILLSSPFYKSQIINLKNCLGDTCQVVLEPMLFKLPEMSIVTDRMGVETENVLPSLKIVSGKEMNLGSNGNTADALEKNGVFVQKSQGAGGSPILRGFEANKILLSVDGIRMNNAIYRAGHLQNAISLPKAFLRSVEVLEGGGTVIQGSDALGGVISFRTIPLNFSDTEKWEFDAEYAVKVADVDSSYSGSIVFTGNKNQFSFVTGVSYDNFGDLRQGAERNSKYPEFGKRSWYVDQIDGKDTVLQNQNVNIQKGSAYSQLALLQKLGIKTRDGSIHSLNLQFNRTSDADFYSRLTETAANGNPEFAEWYYGPLIRGMAGYEFRKKTSFLLFDEMLIGLNSQFIEESRHTRRFRSSNLSHRIESIYVQGLNIDLIKKHKNNTVHYGADIRSENIESTANIENIFTKETKTLNTRYPDGGSNVLDLGIYTSTDQKIGDDFVASAGLRFNYYSLKAKFVDTLTFKFPFSEIENKNPAFSGNAGIAYNKNKLFGASIMVESGIRSPNLDDIAKVFESKKGTVVMPNPDLQAERTLGPSIKIWKKFKSDSSLELSAFYLSYNNIITYAPGKYLGADSIIYDGINSAVLTLQNKNEAYSTGMSLSAKANLNDLFSMNAGLTYTYGRIKTDSTDYPLDHIPPLYGRAGIKYTKQKLIVNANVIFQSEKPKKDYNLFGEDNFRFATSDGMPGWITYNLSGMYQFNSRINLEAGIENILDKNYRTFASGISSPGRTLFLGIKGNF